MDPLRQALAELRQALVAARLGLALPAAEQTRRQTSHLIAQLDDYLVPRLGRLNAPMLAVVGGSTGAGKSTLVNSLLRAAVSPAGVLRPTTRSPVLVCNPDDVGWFGETYLLPGLPRVRAAGDGPRLHVVTTPELPAGVALLDAPDIDSVVDANRELAGQLLAAGDLWLFLTTASRYADAVPWDVLRDARERGAAVAVVLDRVPVEAREAVGEHLGQMLTDHGFGDSPLFVVAEQPLDHQGLLPDEAVAPIQQWFGALAYEPEHREAVVRQTLAGALSALPPQIDAIAVQAQAQHDAVALLRVTARNAYAERMKRVEEGVREGALLRGETLARWLELVDSGEVARALNARAGTLGWRLRAALTRWRGTHGREFQDALSSAAAALITTAAEDAAEQTAAQWASHSGGHRLMEPQDEDDQPRVDYHRASEGAAERVEQLVADWQQRVLELVLHDATDSDSANQLTTRLLHATGLLVMIGVFVSAAYGSSESEGPTSRAQKVVQRLLADQELRELITRAEEDLLDRVRVLLDDERQRYTDLLHQLNVNPSASDRLQDAGSEVERARVAVGLAPNPDALAAVPLPEEELADEELPEAELADDGREQAPPAEAPAEASEEAPAVAGEAQGSDQPVASDTVQTDQALEDADSPNHGDSPNDASPEDADSPDAVSDDHAGETGRGSALRQKSKTGEKKTKAARRKR
ncbi:MAG: ABC transporter [Micromonosporaceae bacterium]